MGQTSHIPNDTRYGESLHFLIGEFMNLVSACERKGIEFGTGDGFTLRDCKSTVDWYLRLIGFEDDHIVRLWTGEDQLTSS